MQKSFCDRCEEFIPSPTQHHRRIAGTIFLVRKGVENIYNDRTLDLCPSCEKSFEKWIKVVKEDNK